MLGLTGTSKSTIEMEAAGIIFRTITINKDGIPTESMPFKTFEFNELIEKTWEQSSIREEFVDLKIMLFVFKEINSVITFERIVFWNVPNSIVDGEIKDMYVKCADLVKHGEAFYYDKNGKIKDKFPKESRNSNGICHVRPHARNSKDKYFLPMTDKETGINSYTKQSFWFNKSFIFKILKDSE